MLVPRVGASILSVTFFRMVAVGGDVSLRCLDSHQLSANMPQICHRLPVGITDRGGAV